MIETIILFSLFLNLSLPVLAWKEAIMVFLSFLNFFAIFFQFYTKGRVGNDRNDNFYFDSFSTIPNLFWLEKKLLWCFLVFLFFFLLFFFRFSVTGLVGNDQNDNFYFHSFSAFPNQFWLEKKAIMAFFFFFNFLAIRFGVLYSASDRNGMEW